MGILVWIVLGLVAGALAKFILPGKQGGGFIVTTVLGVIGALVGGFLGTRVFGFGEVTGFDLQRGHRGLWSASGAGPLWTVYQEFGVVGLPSIWDFPRWCCGRSWPSTTSAVAAPVSSSDQAAAGFVRRVDGARDPSSGRPEDPHRPARLGFAGGDLGPDRTSLRPRAPGPVAGSALAGPGRDRPSDAHHGAPPARSAGDHGPCPGPDAPQPGHRCPPRRLADPDLRAPPILRVGRLARRPPDDRSWPVWRVLMRRERESGRWQALAEEHAAAIAEMREILRRRKEVANRDFAMGERMRVDHYRGRKDSAIALHYLWRTGEAMISSTRAVRAGLCRDLEGRAEAAAPRSERCRGGRVPAAQADRVRGPQPAGGSRVVARTPDATIGGARLARAARRRRHAHRGPGRGLDRTALGPRLGCGGAARRSNAGVSRGRGPRSTRRPRRRRRSCRRSTSSARGVGRSRCSASTTRGRSTRRRASAASATTRCPSCGAMLVARFDGLSRPHDRTLHVLGLWLEDEALATDEAFHEAFARGMTRYRRFLDADRLDVSAVTLPAIRRRLASDRADDLEVAS